LLCETWMVAGHDKSGHDKAGGFETP